MSVLGLPFREVVVADFEFISESGATPAPVCMVARELCSGRVMRMWCDELPADPPFATGPDTLFVAFYAPAELGCFLELGWPIPERVLDLYVEFRNETNGTTLPEGRGLLSACSHHGLPSITSAEKDTERALIMRGGPWSDDERRRILDYCATDVEVLPALLERMLPRIRSRRGGLGQALLRGRYMTAVARMERTGVPIDVETLDKMRTHWSAIKLDLIEAVDKDYGVYEGATFKVGLFAGWLADRKIDWPRTETGALRLDQDTFRDMSKLHPSLDPLRELRHTIGQLRLERLAVGPDGRNRTMLSPFGARSGRNTPSGNEFIFGPSTWLRGLIKPRPGRAVGYLDWSSQEVWIAAVLSGDAALLDALRSGDPYLAFAKRAGLAPTDATKQTHKQIRDMCKTCVLGTNYGMGARSLAYRTGLSMIEANDLLRRLAVAFPVFTEWAEHAVDVAMLTGRLSTVFGWTVRVASTTRPTALRNYPMQANAAEMLRLGACLATEAGIQVCAPVHDALLIEADTDQIDEVIERTRAAMAQASATVLGGVEIGVDADTVVWPDRYADPRGAQMWETVTRLIGVAEMREVDEVRDIREVVDVGEVRDIREVGDI